MSSRPNILFIQTDSHDGRVMGCAGHPAMQRATPNMDALAAGGVMWPTAYTTNPICCPARASMWSGQYTHHCEGWNNYKGLEPGTPTFGTVLADAGYRVQTFGKTDYLSGAHTIRARVSAWTRSAWIDRPQYQMHEPKVLADAGERVHEADWADVDRSVEFLRDAAARPDEPFMLYLGIRQPHPGFVTSPHYLDLIDADAVELPPADEADHPALAYQRAVKNWEHGLDPEMGRRVRHIYYAMCAQVDAMVGRVLAGLADAGLADSTYVIFTSDHGELAMEHEQFYKMNLLEGSARIPLIIRGPGVESGVRIDTPGSLIDMYPTLMDMAGVGCPAGLDGESLMPALTGSPSGRRDWAFSEYHDTTMPTGNFMLRRGDWKHLVYVGCQPQLFNIADDPNEVHNCAAERPEVVADMDARLREIVDYEAVDAKVKAYDRAAFRQYRDEATAAGTYRRDMARTFAGWDGLPEDHEVPWRAADAALIDEWLATAG